MSILSKTHVGVETRFPIIESVVTGSFGRFRCQGVAPKVVVGFDSDGYYVDLFPKVDSSIKLYADNKFYYAKNHVDSYDVDGDRKRYNEYICLMKNRDSKLMCPYFRYRNIYGDLSLYGCQWFKSLDHIDHIHGNVYIEDVVHPVEMPDDLIIDGTIRVVKNHFLKEYDIPQYKSQQDYRGRF